MATQAGGALLPSVSEAVALLDVSAVHNDGHSTPAAIRRAVQILVDHIQVQNVQLSRVEDILAAFGNPSQQGGTIWSKLSAKADLNRVEKLEAQLDAALEQVSLLKSKQSDSALRSSELNQQVEVLRDNLAVMEASVGINRNSLNPGASLAQQQGSTQSFMPGGAASAGASMAGGSPAGRRPMTANAGSVGTTAGLVGNCSLMERQQRLERRIDALSAANHKNQEDAAEALLKLRGLEPRVDGQLSSLRTDIKQALVLAASSSRDAAEAQAVSRTKELEKRLLARVHSMEESWELRVAGVSTKVSASLSQELDGRFSGVYDHLDMQVAQVRTDMERLLRDKVDVTALDTYTARVSDSFEQVAGALHEELQTVSDRTAAHIEATRVQTAAELAGKADKEVEHQSEAQGEVLQILQERVSTLSDALEQQVAALSGALQQQVDSLAQPLAAHQASLLELTSGLTAANSQLDSAHKSITGLNSAITSTSSALELQAHKLTALGHRLQAGLSDVAGLKEALYGPGGTAASAALDNVTAACHTPPGTVSPTQNQRGAITAAAGTGPSLAARLAGVERGLAEVGTALGTKADEAGVREVQRQLMAVQRQADHASEGVRVLTQSTYKRVDEHASAIQKLTLAITSHMEERPTLSAVQHIVERSGLELADKLATALLPVWDAVKALQGSLREVSSEAHEAMQQVCPLQQSCEELRAHVTGSSGLLASLVAAAASQQVDAALGAAGSHGLRARVDAVEAELRNALQQVEVVAALQDRHQALLSAVEDQLSVAQSSVKGNTAAVRTELQAQLQAAATSLDSRLGAAEASLRQLVASTKEVVEQLAHRPVMSEVQQVAGHAAKQSAEQQAEKEAERWQAWLELHSGQMQQLATKSQLDAAITAAADEARCAAQATEAASLAAARQAEERAVEKANAKAEARWRHVEEQMSTLSGQMEAQREAVAATASQQEVSKLACMVADMPSRAALEATFRSSQEEACRQVMLLRHHLEGELAKKLDVRTFLSSSASAAATAAATAAKLPSSSPAAAAAGPNVCTSAAAVQPLQQLPNGHSQAAPPVGTAPLHNWQQASIPSVGTAVMMPGHVAPGQLVMGAGSAAAAAAIARLGEKLRQASLTGSTNTAAAPHAAGASGIHVGSVGPAVG